MEKENLEFLINDISAVKQFVNELPPRMRRLRFGNISTDSLLDQWRPEHTLIVANNGTMLALADVIRTPDNRLGNFSLVSKENCALYAIIALLHLKGKFPVETVETAFTQPTEMLVGLAKRWADVIYDQETWANAREFTIKYGTGTHLAPTPIVLTRKNQILFSIPDPNQMDLASKRQIAASCLVENHFQISTKKYGPIPKSIITTLGFEITNMELIKRQKVTRSILLNSIHKMKSGSDNQNIAITKNSSALNLFRSKLEAILKDGDAPINGQIFKLIRISR